MSIKRVWRGWTTPDNAAAYEEILLSHVIPGIEAKRIPGYRSIEVLREHLGDEVEFCTVMAFDSLDNVVAFQGADYARAYVPDRARAVLKRWDQVSRHYEVRAVRDAG
jgi:antibiotic biosynthesis monooxygenase (ABM) superfamily enzyme